jgi:hypothetical protein
LFNGDNNVITNSISYQDFDEAGTLRLVSLNQLAVANADFDSAASINVYAWVTDIDLGPITATNKNITAESRRGNKQTHKNQQEKRHVDDSGDGQEPGPVSTVASAVATVGDALSVVPVIGGIASTASTIARGVGKVASLFGFSRPPVMVDTQYVKHLTFSGGANTSGKVTVQKLTVDPNQELSMDTLMTGTTEDCMSIQKIAAVETFYTTIPWQDDDVAMSGVLWTA